MPKDQKGEQKQRGQKRDAEKRPHEAAASGGGTHATASLNTIDHSEYTWFTTAGFGAGLRQEAAEREARLRQEAVKQEAAKREAENVRVRELQSQQAADTAQRISFRSGTMRSILPKVPEGASTATAGPPGSGRAPGLLASEFRSVANPMARYTRLGVTGDKPSAGGKGKDSGSSDPKAGKTTSASRGEKSKASGEGDSSRSSAPRHKDNEVSTVRKEESQEIEENMSSRVKRFNRSGLTLSASFNAAAAERDEERRQRDNRSQPSAQAKKGEEKRSDESAPLQREPRRKASDRSPPIEGPPNKRAQPSSSGPTLPVGPSVSGTTQPPSLPQEEPAVDPIWTDDKVLKLRAIKWFRGSTISDKDLATKLGQEFTADSVRKQLKKVSQKVGVPEARTWTDKQKATFVQSMRSGKNLLQIAGDLNRTLEDVTAMKEKLSETIDLTRRPGLTEKQDKRRGKKK